MALPPVQAKVNFPPEEHALIAQFAQMADMTIGEWCREQLSKVLAEKVHDARLIVEAADRAGLGGTKRDPAPKARPNMDLPFSTPGNR